MRWLRVGLEQMELVMPNCWGLMQEGEGGARGEQCVVYVFVSVLW